VVLPDLQKKIPKMIRDALRFLLYNLQHYSFALWGLRLRLDPPYPMVMKFFPELITDSVFEYRTYGLHAFWAVLLAWLLPLPVAFAFVLFWLGQSCDRTKFYRSNFLFWKQAMKENGPDHQRTAGRYMEHIIRELERRMKAREEWQGLSEEAFRLQDEVIRRGTAKRGPTAP